MKSRLLLFVLSVSAVVAGASSVFVLQLRPAAAAVTPRGFVMPVARAASRSACAPSMLAPLTRRSGSLVWRACDGSVFARFDYGASSVSGTAYGETSVSAAAPQVAPAGVGLPRIPGAVVQGYLGFVGHAAGSAVTYAAPLADQSEIVSRAILRGASYELVGYVFAPGDRTAPYHVLYQSGVYTATSSGLLVVSSPLAGLAIPNGVRVYFAVLAVRHGAAAPLSPPAAPTNAAPAAAGPSLTLSITDNSYGAWVVGSATAQYTLTVGNAGAAATDRAIAVRDALPIGIALSTTPTGNGWVCKGGHLAKVMLCTSTAAIRAHGSAASISVPVIVGAAAPHWPNTVTDTATTYGGGDPLHGTDTTPLAAHIQTTVDRANVTKTIFLTDSRVTSWLVPSDWNSSKNTIEVIGGGGSGGLTNDVGAAGDGGGGGGAYSAVDDVALPPGSAVGISVGAGGATGADGNPNPVLNGGDTYVCRSVPSCKSLTSGTVIVGAQGGSGLIFESGSGGNAAFGIGAITFSGGSGNGTLYNEFAADFGGGGAAGRQGNGIDSDAAGDGGYGDAGFGGAPGGGNGTEFDATHGSGGGGSGSATGLITGGAYGGGGGFNDDGFSYAGAGVGGIIVITYVPTASPVPRALSLTMTDNSAGGWGVGAAGAAYTITAGNAGSASTVGAIAVTDELPRGITLRGTPSGAGWTCNGHGAGSGNLVRCTSTTPIRGGATGAPIAVPVNVGPAARGTIANTALAYGGGDPLRSSPQHAAVAQRHTPAL